MRGSEKSNMKRADNKRQRDEDAKTSEEEIKK